ncbi:MAG: phenylalanine--tRNA ligase subunit alpha [Candidatus Hydrogenedentota bacterium]|nr:MAG: phenylalanine--tRNA ligase subunit alpha [Candidatus Hydrogenedentota bacterium]
MRGEFLEQVKKITEELAFEHQAGKLEELRIEFLGKKGKLTQILKGLASVSPQDRAEIGKVSNQLKVEFSNALEQAKSKMKEKYYASLHDAEWIDMSIPPAAELHQHFGGSVHPISLTQKKLENIFTSMGFSILDGPQVETDYYNFGALNFTDDHPAREMQDTFYTEQGHLLRTHTSAVQVRGMKKLKPPMRMIVPGRVFRYEEVDASHEHTFYQMEGMILEKEVSVSHLLYLMQTLLKEIFESEVEVRLRPGYFPFVEPGFELDMRCLLCKGEGCSVCKKTGWVEVLPCGLVHPEVIKSGGLNPDEWQGAAFGLGLNRLVMMEHNIEDIRLFMGAHVPFLSQFKEILN